MLARRCARALAVACIAWAVACGAAPFAAPVDMGHGVHVFLGAPEAPSRANRGHVGNQAFILAAAGVIVIDTGPSAAFAAHMLREIRARSAQPLAMVILTGPVDEAIFGATLFQEHGAAVLAHEDAARLIARRCQACLERRRLALGAELMAGTGVPRPGRLFKGSQTLVVAGRSLELLDHSGAAAPGSIAIWDPESGTLFAGGLASFGRIPETRDGALGQWIKALSRLAQVPARAVIAGHGPVENRAGLDSVAAYLSALRDGAARAYAEGAGLLEAPRRAAVPAHRHWALYDVVHPSNVHHAYLELERRDLRGEPP